MLEGFRASYPEMLEMISTLGEEDLIQPDWFDWRKGYPLWHMLVGNAWWHYKGHREGIEIWLEKGIG